MLTRVLSTLRDRFDRSRIRAARAAYTAVSGWRSQRDGFLGMVDEMQWGLEQLSPEQRDRADHRVLSSIFFGRAGLLALAAARAGAPGLTARTMAWSAPAALRWLVGEITTPEATRNELPRCEFRRVGGDSLCQQVCRRPTERFCASYVVSVRLDPEPNSLRCRWSWG